MKLLWMGLVKGRQLLFVSFLYLSKMKLFFPAALVVLPLLL
jgi:hypothetical protein